MDAAEKTRVALELLKRHERVYGVTVPPRLVEFWQKGEALAASGKRARVKVPSFNAVASFRVVTAVPSWEAQAEVGLDDAVVGAEGEWEGAASCLPLFHLEQGRYLVTRLDDARCPVGYFEEETWREDGGGYLSGVFVLSKTLDSFLKALTDGKADIETDDQEESWDDAKAILDSTADAAEAPDAEATLEVSAFVPMSEKRAAVFAKLAGGLLMDVDNEAVTEKMAPLQSPDRVLAAVIGDRLTTRPDALKQVMAYAAEKKLQADKRIRADAKLQPLFEGRDEVDMFELAKLIGKHLE